MPARDFYHDTVKNVLIKDGWTITHDPFPLRCGGSRTMESLAGYRELIQRVITRHAQIPSVSGEVRIETIFDTAQDHYALVYTGWDGLRRIEGEVIHIDIINGKIWIQHDGTEYGVARELEDLGVSRQEIVLGFHAPVKRPLTGYAVG